jgi:acyl transferase domain-containing protein
MDSYRGQPGQPATTRAAGGYFLSEDIRNFDNSFFGINNREASGMDPQQRKLLEVVFECLESAGTTLDDVSGANIGCYGMHHSPKYY